MMHKVMEKYKTETNCAINCVIVYDAKKKNMPAFFKQNRDL